MTTNRQKPIHPFIERIIKSDGFDEVRPFARHHGLDERNMLYISEGNAGRKIIQQHIRLAEAKKIPIDVYFTEYLKDDE